MVEYALRFNTLAAESQWNEPALKAVFRRALNSKILKEQACWAEEAKLDSWIDMSIKIVNILWDRSATFTCSPNRTYHS